MEAVIFVGIQAVGKSSFYRQRFFDTHLRINLDMLKTRHREQILITACLTAKQPFVVDNTNVRIAERERYLMLAKAARFRVVGYYFPSRIQDALARNRQRPESARVPDKGVLGTAKRVQLPRLDEGFDALYCVTLHPDQGFIVQEWHDAV